MNKIYYFLGVLLVQVGVLSAQQTPMMAEYNYNTYVVNPAYAGLVSDAEIAVSHHGFLGDVEGSPQVTSINAVIPFRYKNFGLGVGFTNDKIGVTTNNSVSVSYAYRLDLDGDSRPQWARYRTNAIAFSVTAGFRFFQDDLLSLSITDDPRLNHNVQATIPMIGVGVVYNHDRFFAGFSMPNVIGDFLSDNPDEVQITTPMYSYFGYRLFTDRFNGNTIRPNVLLKYEKGAPLQADFNVAYSYKNSLEVGVGYKTVSAFNVMLGANVLQNARIMYNFTYGFGNYILKSQHGFLLSYRFGDGYQK